MFVLCQMFEDLIVNISFFLKLKLNSTQITAAIRLTVAIFSLTRIGHQQTEAKSDQLAVQTKHTGE